MQTSRKEGGHKEWESDSWSHSDLSMSPNRTTSMLHGLEQVPHLALSRTVRSLRVVVHTVRSKNVALNYAGSLSLEGTVEATEKLVWTVREQVFERKKMGIRFSVSSPES